MRRALAAVSSAITGFVAQLSSYAHGLYLLVISLMALAVLCGVAYLVYVIVAVRHPRVTIPFHFVNTRRYVFDWVQRVVALQQRMQKAADLTDVALAQMWRAGTDVATLLRKLRDLIAFSGSQDQFQKDVGAYVRLKSMITDLDALLRDPDTMAFETPDAWLPSKFRASSWFTCRYAHKRPLGFCEDKCLSEVLQKYFAINGYTTAPQRDRLRQFIAKLEALSRDIKAYTARASDELLETSLFAIDSNPFSDGDVALYGKDARVTDAIDALQDGHVAIFELAVLLGPVLSEMVEFYGSRRAQTQESIRSSDLIQLAGLAPRLMWFKVFGYACKKHWYEGIKCLWESDKSCSRNAFEKTFTMRFAIKVWTQLMLSTVRKFRKEYSKRSRFFQPAQSAASGWGALIALVTAPFRNLVNFLTGALWFVRFMLTHLTLVLEMGVMLVVATVIAFVLMLVAVPGINWCCWAVYWYGICVCVTLYHALMLAAYTAYGSLLFAAEFVVRVVSGGAWSLEFLFRPSLECRPQLGAWHERHPKNTYFAPAMGCRLPCRRGFSSTHAYDWTCGVNPAWQPDLCPQQQVYRKVHDMRTGRLATLDAARATDMTPDRRAAGALKREFDAHKSKIEFVEDCMRDPALAPYNDMVARLCMKRASVRDDPGIVKLCRTLRCECRSCDDADWLCKEFDSIEKAAASDNPVVNRNLVAFAAFAIVIICCMAAHTILSSQR